MVIKTRNLQRSFFFGAVHHNEFESVSNLIFFKFSKRSSSIWTPLNRTNTNAFYLILSVSVDVFNVTEPVSNFFFHVFFFTFNIFSS